jgi:hypothetical protein
MDRNTTIGIGVCGGLLALACCCAAVVGLGGVFYFYTGPISSSTSPPFPTGIYMPDTDEPEPTEVIEFNAPTPLPPMSDGASTLEVLRNTIVPPNNLREVAERLRNLPDIPEVASDTAADWPIGQELEFRASNTDTDENFSLTARLIYKTENVYFFADTRVTDIDETAVRAVVDEFQTNAYRVNREFFGSEWTPGVDGDPHVYILYARGLGFSVGGYYSSADQYVRAARPDSNEKEMFYINADGVDVGDEFIRSVLAHEFQHMIHWYQDTNETTWMNEGAAQLAEQLNGFDAGTAFNFTSDPDLQLTTWDGEDPLPNYGAAYMFMSYFLDRFGEAATQALVAHPENGMVSVDAVLTELGMTNADGSPMTHIDVFADWVAANLIGDSGVADGRYGYVAAPSIPTVSPTRTFSTCPIEPIQTTVRQFGTDYWQFRCEGEYILSLAGNEAVRVVPTDIEGGRYAIWGNREDESVALMTREFDLAGVNNAELAYDTWYSIEQDYDYAYVEISTDGGATWQIVRAPGTTDTNPTGANFGWGYTGESGGWRRETVDLTPFAGNKVLIRFEYITDAALNFPGILIDNIEIAALNYREDFEGEAAGWELTGMARIDNQLPQEFLVQVITQDGDSITVERLTVSAGSGQLPITISSGQTVTVSVSGVTPFTTEPAEYTLSLE